MPMALGTWRVCIEAGFLLGRNAHEWVIILHSHTIKNFLLSWSTNVPGFSKPVPWFTRIFWMLVVHFIPKLVLIMCLFPPLFPALILPSCADNTWALNLPNILEYPKSQSNFSLGPFLLFGGGCFSFNILAKSQWESREQISFQKIPYWLPPQTLQRCDLLALWSHNEAINISLESDFLWFEKEKKKEH